MCVSDHYFQELEESNLDLNKQEISRQSGVSNENYTLRRSSENTFPQPRFMTMLRQSILKSYQESTSSQEDSPVKTSAMLESELASRGVVLHFGSITSKPLAKYDQESHSLRTFQHSLTGDSMLYSATLPRSGMLQNGIVYQLPPLVHLTVVTGSLLLPTPTVMDSVQRDMSKHQDKVVYQKNGKPRLMVNGKNGSMKLSNLVQMWRTPSSTDMMRGGHKTQAKKIMNGETHRKSGHLRQITLAMQVHMFPTPTTRDWKGSTKKNREAGNPKRHLDGEVNGQLNPMWVEWLMAFPAGWTELSVSETLSYQQLRKQSQKQSKKRLRNDLLFAMWT